MKLLILGRERDALHAQLTARASERGVAIDSLASPGADEAVTRSRSTLPDEATLGAACAGVSAVIDTWTGRARQKRRRLRRLDGSVPLDVPLLVCCHDMSATECASGLAGADRVVGYGLMPPVGERVTVECARALQTADAAAHRSTSIWHALGFEPEWVGDGAGLVTARVVACLANEAIFAMTDGTADPDAIDLAMTLGTRYPRGPIAWAELAGLAHVLNVLDGLAREHGEDRYRAAPALRRWVAAGWTTVPRS